MSKGATSKGQLQPDQNEKPNLTLLMLLTAIVPDKQSKKNAPPVMQDELETEAKRFTVRQVEEVQRRDIWTIIDLRLKVVRRLCRTRTTKRSSKKNEKKTKS